MGGTGRWPRAAAAALGPRRERPSDRVMARSIGRSPRIGLSRVAASVDGPAPSSIERRTATVTTPIYYVNAEPHLGHAYTTIAADVLARHMRQRGEDVFFSRAPTSTASRSRCSREARDHSARARRPQRGALQGLASRVNVTNDFFIRTTDPEHYEVVERVVQAIHDNDFVFEGTYEGWYCPRCADFKTDSELEEGNRCPIHKIVLQREEGGQLVLPLRLPGAARGALRRATGLRDPGATTRRSRSSSRAPGHLAVAARLKWGVPVPWDRDR